MARSKYAPLLDNKFRAIVPAPAMPGLLPQTVPVMAVAAGPLPPAVPLSLTGTGVMVERRLGGKKISMPTTITGDEDAQSRALTYHAVVSILETECYGIRYDIRIRMLGSILNQDFVANRSITEFLNAYEEQLRDPDRFTILSYHNLDGDVLPNTTCVADSMVLKPTGDTVTGTLQADRRTVNIKFVTYKVAFDFSDLFLKNVECNKIMALTNTVELPQTIHILT